MGHSSMRTEGEVSEELEGFIDGLFGDEEVIDLPERANEALDNLGEINSMMHGILDLMDWKCAAMNRPSRSNRGTAREVSTRTGWSFE